MTLKAGTVCYLRWQRGWPDPDMEGRVVTIVGAPRGGSGPNAVYPVAETLYTASGRVFHGVKRKALVPISDPDQPVDVTSDTDEPVTV